MYTEGLSRSDKFKTGVEKYVEKTLENEYDAVLQFGKLPVMVKSDLCLMNSSDKKDCEFDDGGYFVIKGAEKVRVMCQGFCQLFL